MPSDGVDATSETGCQLEALLEVCDDGVRLVKRDDSLCPYWLIFDAFRGGNAIGGETLAAAVASAHRDYVANPPLRDLAWSPRR